MSTQINLNNTTPSAPSGGQNTLWQSDASSPTNVSAYIDFSNVTVPIVTRVGFSSPKVIDASSQLGADWGAKVNAAIALLPNGGIVDARNFTGPVTMSTAISPVVPICIILGPYQVNHSVPFTLSGNCAIIGQPGGISILNKTASLAAQIEISGSNVAIRDLTITGANVPGTGPTYTGAGTECGILIDVGQSATLIQNCVFNTPDGDAVTDKGSNDTVFSNNQVNYPGANGYNQTYFCYQTKISNCFMTDYLAAGSAIVLNSGEIVISNCRIETYSAYPTINGGSSNGILEVVNCRLLNSNGYPVYKHTSAATSITNSYLSGGGTGGPTISATSGQLILTGNNINGPAANDVIYASGLQNGNLIIADNQLNTNFASTGHALIHILGDAIGNVIHHNAIYFNVGEAPTGDNYGVWIQAQTGHCIMHRITENIFRGASNAYDIPIFMDNTAALAVASQHAVSKNSFIDTSASGGIMRYDVNAYMSTIFEHNQSQAGPVFIGSLTGNTGIADTIIELDTRFTLSNVPVCGPGSLVVISGAVPSNPIRTATDGTNVLGTRLTGASNWVACSSPIITQVNNASVSASITTTNLISTAASGQYMLTWNTKITTPAGVSSSLGPLSLTWVTPDGVTQTISAAGALSDAGAIVTLTATNSTTASLNGIPLLLSVKEGTAITYALTLTSSGSAPVAELNICLEVR